jgi:hypothetical protein
MTRLFETGALCGYCINFQEMVKRNESSDPRLVTRMFNRLRNLNKGLSGNAADEFARGIASL